METSFSRWHRRASDTLNRLYNFFRTPGAINPHLIPYFGIPVWLEILQLNYQNGNNTPFETHPISMCVATASFLAYCLAHDANLRFSAPPHQFSPTCLNILRFSTWFSGQLSLASLAAVLFPDSAAFIPYVLYCVLAVGELLYCVYYRTMGDRICEWLFHGRFGLVPLQQRFLSLWTSMVDQLRDGHFQERLQLLRGEWRRMIDQLQEWPLHGRLGRVMRHFVLMIMRLWRQRILVSHHTHILPVYMAPGH